MRVNLEKKEERDRITRALLRVTLRLAAEHGFTSLGLREVARAADIAPTSFYRHFSDMEELGLALIEELVGPFVGECAAPDSVVDVVASSLLDAIVSRTLRGAVEDPELMRFILAERLGPIPSFRTALVRKLAVLLAALQEALLSEERGNKAKLPAHINDGALVLLLEGCGTLLELGQEHVPMLRKRVVAQINALATGAARSENSA
ncbi:MAG TPA: TetR family transcriptional regulator [Polyangiaceae bacterium]|nr:TetR family transcriptional regulator [Polyangiaceae bacterium]